MKFNSEKYRSKGAVKNMAIIVLHYLQYLNVSNNSLTSVDVTNAKNIENLFVFNNAITSFNASNCSKLNMLNAYCCGIYSDSEEPITEFYITGCTALEGLYCSSSNISSSTLLETVAGFTKLTTLDLSYNQLSGEIPEELGNLTNLTHLNLEYNDLTGTVPASVMKLEAQCTNGFSVIYQNNDVMLEPEVAL